jgi:hypothetical protein
MNVGFTPLHNAFKSSNYSIICKCLSGTFPPNLNAVTDDCKTPLAFCQQRVLELLGLQEGVIEISSSSKLKFDNNALLCRSEDTNCNDELEGCVEIRRKSRGK